MPPAVAKMNPAESAAILQRFMKPTIGGPPLGGGAGGVDTADIINLSTRRHQQADDMAHTLSVQDELTKMGVSPALHASGATPSDLASVQRDIANDPYTGDVEQARMAKRQSAADIVQQFMNPDQTEMRQAQEAAKARELSVVPNIQQAGETTRTGMQQTGETGRASAQQTAETERERMKGETERYKSDQLLKSKGFGAFDDTGHLQLPPNMKPLDQNEQRAISTLHEGAPLLGELESTLDPSKAQPLDKVSTVGKWLAYKSGIGLSPIDQKRMQIAGLIEVMGATPYMQGSRNYQLMKQIQRHLTDPTATDAFLYQQVQELKRIWPVLQEEIIRAHIAPGSELNFGMPGASGAHGDVITDPNWGR